MDARAGLPATWARQQDPNQPSPTQAGGDNTPANELLKLAQNPFQSRFVANAFWASFATSIGITVGIALLFSLLRPHATAFYAPKCKNAQSKYAPPTLGRGLFAWVTPLVKKREADLMHVIGMDAIIFLRFTRMCRNLFLIMSVIGCAVLIPTNVTGSLPTAPSGLSYFTLMTPLYVSARSLWAQVVCSWLFDIMVVVSLWWNYRAVVRLRRSYFASPEYQARLHSRTLIITEIPKTYREDNGLYMIANGAMPTSSLPRCAIGRDVKGLTELIEQHTKTVHELEKVLAKYLKHPHNLPPARPTTRPSAELHGYAKGQRVDAIEYLTDRIRSLEYEIKEARQNIGKREPMSYGFVSYNSIPEAHAIAYGTRKVHPKGTTVKLAPPPEDLIWKNLPLTKSAKRWKKLVNGLWVGLLTVIWIAPNALIALFLSDLNNLGLLWPAFQVSLQASPVVWAAVQGIAAPAITSLFYFVLPIIFRRLGIRAGDITKASRERHVIHQLYAFFIFNNLVVFTAFSAVAQFIAAVTNGRAPNESVWDAIVNGQLGNKLANALCNVSPFWVTYILQRNLGAAIDLSQIVTIIWVWWMKAFHNPTPRQRYEWTRPPTFDYASYYNYFLFYATVSLCFATLQPLVLPVTAFYFALDSLLKKYLLMYVFVTKNESGGQFWRVLFNRLVFGTIMSNVAVALILFSRETDTYPMVYSMAPLPFIMLAFKLYCRRAFDDDLHYASKIPPSDMERMGANDKQASRNEKLGTRFGNPALYKPLITPIVLDEAKEVLTQIYRGRLDSEDVTDSGYSDIHMDPMSETHPGKPQAPDPTLPFDFVSETHLDFASSRNRADFGDDSGRPLDLITERSDTPRSFMPRGRQTSTYSIPSRSSSPSTYAGYPSPPPLPEYGPHHPAYRSGSPLSRINTSYSGADPRGMYASPNESESDLIHHAAGMATAHPPPRPPHSRSGSSGSMAVGLVGPPGGGQTAPAPWSPTKGAFFRAPAAAGYGQVPQHTADSGPVGQEYPEHVSPGRYEPYRPRRM
ncbi:MAG: hypothetical protein M1838_002355 [Thelocarpon superellum]|nr:MAG: hypothetical protein M1838_002355 [Thelocarpon superellum]